MQKYWKEYAKTTYLAGAKKAASFIFITSEPVLNEQGSHPLIKADVLWRKGFSTTCVFFCHSPQLVAISEGRKVDWPVNRQLFLPPSPHHNRPLDRSVCQSPAPVSPHSWKRPEDTRFPQLEAQTLAGIILRWDESAHKLYKENKLKNKTTLKKKKT